MSERIDVLAVLRAEQVRAGRESAERFEAAISAVSNLIEAAKAIKANPHVHLGDLVYQVREREGEGWDGPAVTQWGDAVAALDAAIERIGGAA